VTNANTTTVKTHSDAIAAEIAAAPGQPRVIYRKAGTDYILVEYGELLLDINLRLRVDVLEKAINLMQIDGVIEMSPGVRSLLIHYDGLRLSLAKLVEILRFIEQNLEQSIPKQINSRTVNLPFAFNDGSVKEALEKYMGSIRKEAPYLPDNMEFIARCNDLSGPEEVLKYMLESQYMVLGLGDVYLGAPCATALDPRKRMVVPKYNPARTWTAEGGIGLGGAFLCIYPMASPGGYQLVGRTLPIWNTFQTSRTFEDAPWLLRHFDKINFVHISEEELTELRAKVLRNEYEFDITEDVFNIDDYNTFVSEIKPEIETFRNRQRDAVATAMAGY
jgi:urea carboxylase